jgi:NADPH:quinone reductase-like Zn-dependent oxidoreductase
VTATTKGEHDDPGVDGMGVEHVGPDVDADSGLVVGRRVVFVPVHGTWAEQITVPAASGTPVPDDVSDQVACQVMTNGVTAILLLRRRDRGRSRGWRYRPCS